MKELALGKGFALPLDAQVQTFAIMGVRGAGKTVAATVLAEEFAKAGLPWVAFDPVSVWWGLRADREGKPGGYPVVILGGKRGDLPLEKTHGRRVAEAIAKEPLCVVVDVKDQSKKFWHTFMTDLALGLMDAEPETPRHVFVEEAPEFCPQKTRVELTARCREAVERLVRLGRNQGYGSTLISQRPAIIDKDVLSQCGNLLVLRTLGSHDYKALNEWLKAALGTDESQREAMKDLARLPDGTGYFWSPAWLGKFSKVAIRERETFHPGETRKVGQATASVALSTVKEGVARIGRILTKTVAAVPSPEAARTVTGTSHPSMNVSVVPPDAREIEDLRLENGKLRDEIRVAAGRLRAANARLELVRKLLEPDWQKLKAVFSDAENGGAPAGIDRAVYEPWLAKAGKRGCRRMLEVLIDRPDLTRVQLATLAGIGPSTGTFRNYLSWLRTNGLVEVTGDAVKLRSV